MLTNKQVKCVYCKRASYFYVHVWKGRAYAAIYTECPKCKKFDDVYHFPLENFEKILKEVLAGRSL